MLDISAPATDDFNMGDERLRRTTDTVVAVTEMKPLANPVATSPCLGHSIEVPLVRGGCPALE